MQPIRASFMAVCVSFGATCAAFADEGYTNPDVIVNPSPGPGVLLYPGGRYGRVVRPLLEPGERQSAPIHLHMPRHRIVAHRVQPHANAVAAETPQAPAAPPAPLVTDASPGLGNVTTPPPVTPPPAATVPPPPKRPAKTKLATAMPKPAAPQPTPPPAPPSSQATAGSGNAIPFTLAPEENGLPPGSTRTAKVEPTSAHNEAMPAGLVKQSQINFAPGAPDPSPDAIDAIKTLATPINAALAAGANTVLVTAYGGGRGDKSSEARRLSLKRALVIRQLLIDGGVPSDHINVRAMGGASDEDGQDRVDIFTKT